jgi:hypothetical protein
VVAIRVEPYEPALRETWDEFVRASKNGTFLFERGYVEYHADRFPDESLVLYEDDRLVALLPATRDGATVSSHAGLTYGGLVTSERMRQALMLELFDALLAALRDGGAEQLVYKPVPHIYHAAPAEEDLYALFRHGASLARRTVSSAIRMDERPRVAELRRRGAAKARRAGIEVRESADLAAFMAIAEERLERAHGVRPVHSAAELELLASRFPQSIRLFAAYGGELLGGILVYESRQVAHAQYIAASDEGLDAGALDAVVDVLLGDVYAQKRFFDFGISTDHSGMELNDGLIANKEGFGARSVVYDTYELSLE